MTQFAPESGEPIARAGAPGEFPPDAYVVRQGAYGAVRGLVTLVVAAAIVGYCLTDPKPVVRPDIGYLIAAALVIFSLVRFRKAISRPIVLAVHSDGVYFGPEVKENVPWSQIRAVEVFTEHITGTSGSFWYRCVGVRGEGPGSDGTVRETYRHVTWLLNRKKLAAAIARFAPGVPVIGGQNEPPPLR